MEKTERTDFVGKNGEMSYIWIYWVWDTYALFKWRCPVYVSERERDMCVRDIHLEVISIQMVHKITWID